MDEIPKTYLIAYNCNMIMGWVSMLFVLLSSVTGLKKFNLYEGIEPILKIFQTAALLEILHVALGLVKSNLTMTTFQVFSRIFVVWGIMHNIPEIHNHLSVMMFLFAWFVTESIRYTYYFFMLIGFIPYYLIWARYSLFIGLYPLGVVGELLCMYKSLHYVEERGILNLTLPNRLNASFNFYYFLIAVMLSYIPIFPQLFSHMLTHREKALRLMAKKSAEITKKKQN